jgi:hypothetical protein
MSVVVNESLIPSLMQPKITHILSSISKCHKNYIQLQHVSALQGHLQAVVHQLKLLHCNSCLKMVL